MCPSQRHHLINSPRLFLRQTFATSLRTHGFRRIILVILLKAWTDWLVELLLRPGLCRMKHARSGACQVCCFQQCGVLIQTRGGWIASPFTHMGIPWQRCRLVQHVREVQYKRRKITASGNPKDKPEANHHGCIWNANLICNFYM